MPVSGSIIHFELLVRSYQLTEVAKSASIVWATWPNMDDLKGLVILPLRVAASRDSEINDRVRNLEVARSKMSYVCRCNISDCR